LENGDVIIGEIQQEKLPFQTKIGKVEIKAGEIMHETITFKTAHGPVTVTIDDFVSFTQGTLQTKDGINIKGTIKQGTIKIKTSGLGELEIKTEDIESITR
ncbi:MAG: hypothetical protein J3T61_04165, partial [Candidatus Brocadiales bacterium]|nr:hypothetical protein [Candidatus Bathyanammoxibius sp.]